MAQQTTSIVQHLNKIPEFKHGKFQLVKWLQPLSIGLGVSQPTQGIDFLPQRHPARKVWHSYWPKAVRTPTWNGVAKIKLNGQTEILLLKVFSEGGELKDDCPLPEGAERQMIRNRLMETFAWIAGIYQIHARDVDASEHHATRFLHAYYSAATMIAVLRFLMWQQIPARVVFVGGNHQDSGDKLSASQNKKCRGIVQRMRQHWVPDRGWGPLTNQVIEHIV